MKFYLSIIFLTLAFFLNINAQNSEEISQLQSCPQPLTKTQLRKLKEQQKRIIIDLEDFVDFEQIEIFVGIETKILSDRKTASLITFQTNSHELTWKDVGEKGSLVAKLHFFLRITSIDKKFDGCFEEKSGYSFKEDEVKKKIPILYQKIFELQKGIYTLVFLVRDIETGKTGIQKIKFEIK